MEISEWNNELSLSLLSPLSLLSLSLLSLSLSLLSLPPPSLPPPSLPPSLPSLSLSLQVLGREVYSSNGQLGGIQIMHNNGVTHLTVPSDVEGVDTIIQWLAYIPKVCLYSMSIWNENVRNLCLYSMSLWTGNEFLYLFLDKR